MEIVTAIVTPVVQSLMVPVKNHLRYLISCTKYVADMRTKIRVLNDARLDVEDHENRNKSNSLEVPKGARSWLQEVEKIDAQVKSIDSTNVASCFNLKGRHKVGRKACKIIQDIDCLMEEKSRIDWTDIPVPLAQVNSIKASTSTPLSGYIDFKSRELTYMKAFNALKADNKPHMIALCGMGGVGKTKMTEKLHKVVREKKMFDFVIKVAIGENMDVFVIQKAVAEQLAIDLKESTKEARVSKLRNGFEDKSNHGKRKFLLILDDVWERVDLKDIGLSPKPDQGIDFKVLLTSRDRSVCIHMGVELDSILNLEVIEDSEAQDFFQQFVNISDDVDLRKLGNGIAIRCHGLPIAIETIALTLKGMNKHVWEDTLSRLEHKDVHVAVGEIFAISYKNLHNEETRLTLLLCGLFPEDFDTPTEDLVRYAWGLKLFRNVDSIREARNRLNAYIERLTHANLLIQSQEVVGCVKMHDLVRSFVLEVGSKGTHSLVVGKWPAKPMSECCKMISLTRTGMHEFPRNPSYPNLLLLKLMHGDDSLRFPEDFYERMKKLEVIAYDKMEYPLHMRSLQCSTNLRTLCLHQCPLIFDYSSIGNLLNLEVLSFAYSSIHKLPSTIVNLKELKLLDLTGCKYLCFDDGILQSLVKLEELYMRGATRKVIVEGEGDELAECSKNLGALEIEFLDKDALPHNISFKNLKRFKISLGLHPDNIYGVRRYSSENTLMLVTNECELLDSQINELFEKTHVLYLHVNGVNDFGDALGASLHNLRLLCICECTNLRYLFTSCLANSLKKLENLQVYKCPVLETLVDGPVEMITFPALKFLFLKKLPMLMSLCKFGKAIQLPQLENLELDDLPNITSIYQHFLKKEVMNSKLKKVKINKMEKLKEIWPSQLSNIDQAISCQLREIGVEKCDSLVNLFPSNPMSLMHHLEEVTVKECGSIDVIFNIDLGASCAGEIEEDDKSNLRTILVSRCGDLREVWRVKGVNNDLPIMGFQNVECIEIIECKSLRDVFTPTTSNFDMKALTKITLNGNQVEEINVVAFPSYLAHTCRYLGTLNIHQFKNAEVAFEIESPNSRKLATTLNNQQLPLLPHLKDLEIYNMERMAHVWKYDRNQCLIPQQEPISSSFLNLTSIRLYRCNRVKYLFSPLIAKLLYNLNYISIDACDAIEEVVSNTDGEYEQVATSICSHTNTIFFPHLDILHLFHLKSLKRIDGVGAKCGDDRLNSTTSVHDIFEHFSQVGVAYSSFHQYLKTIHIKGCDALLDVIPSYVVGRMPKLEELNISDCNSLRKIFEIEGVNEDDIGKGIGDTGSATTKITRSTNITSLELPNLKVLHIEGCHGLEYIFTSFTLESLRKLQELKIKDCSAVQVIVKQQEDDGLIASKDVVFHRLKSLTLIRLEKLKSFFSGKNNFHWRLLDKVVIYGCPEMMVFTPGCSMAPKLKYIHTGVGKHNLECGLNFDWTNAPHKNEEYTSSAHQCGIRGLLQFPWSFSNLVEVHVTFRDELRNEKTIFPCNESVKVDNVVDIEEATAVDKVFEGTNDETILISNKNQFMSTDHPSSSSSSSSSYIWKSDWWTAHNLSNLTKLTLVQCDFLEHVFSYGTAASLVQLQELHISFSRDVKVIVEQVQEVETKANKVVCFPCLKSLKLSALWSLKGFCLGSDVAFEWPSLRTLEIKWCPEITVFTEGRSTTPKLKVIRTLMGLCDATEDLNSFIRTKIQEGFEI